MRDREAIGGNRNVSTVRALLIHSCNAVRGAGVSVRLLGPMPLGGCTIPLEGCSTTGTMYIFCCSCVEAHPGDSLSHVSYMHELLKELKSDVPLFTKEYIFSELKRVVFPFAELCASQVGYVAITVL